MRSHILLTYLSKMNRIKLLKNIIYSIVQYSLKENQIGLIILQQILMDIKCALHMKGPTDRLAKLLFQTLVHFIVTVLHTHMIKYSSILNVFLCFWFIFYKCLVKKVNIVEQAPIYLQDITFAFAECNLHC